MRQANQPLHSRRKHCKYCGELFEPDSKTKGKQRYCSKAACQSKRQRLNEKAWRMRNPDCLEEQYERSRLWHKARPDYSRQRRMTNPQLLQENRIQTRARMHKIRVKEMFDKSKVILTQLTGDKEDKYYLTRGCKWLLLRLTKASLLSRAGILCDNRRRFKQVTNILPQGRLYELSNLFLT